MFKSYFKDVLHSGLPGGIRITRSKKFEHFQHAPWTLSSSSLHLKFVFAAFQTCSDQFRVAGSLINRPKIVILQVRNKYNFFKYIKTFTLKFF